MADNENRQELLGNYRPGQIAGVGTRGCPVGEWHPRARLTEHEVDLMRELHECGVGVSEIARKFGVSKSTTHDVVNYRRRASAPMGWRRVKLTAGARRVVAKYIGPDE